MGPCPPYSKGYVIGIVIRLTVQQSSFHVILYYLIMGIPNTAITIKKAGHYRQLFLLPYPHLVCFTLKHILNVFLVRAHAGFEDRNLISYNFVFLYHYKYTKFNCATLDCLLQGVVIYMFGRSSQNDFCKEERVSAGLLPNTQWCQRLEAMYIKEVLLLL